MTPDAEQEDIDFWAAKNVGVIKGKFGELMRSLDDAIPSNTRLLAQFDAVAEFPVRKYYVKNLIESEFVRQSFEDDLQHVYAGMPYSAQDARGFYQGYDTGWGFIPKRLDVQRKAEDLLLYRTLTRPRTHANYDQA